MPRPRHALHIALTQIRSGLQVAALLRRPIVSSAGIEETLRERLARREQNFLWCVEHLIFANPNSPYRPLLELAGYEFPKIRQLVAARGLDSALDQLRQDGIYVRIQEFKGGEHTVRHGRTFRFREQDFANPRARPLLHARSAGSRSAGTLTAISPEDVLELTGTFSWLWEQYGLQDRDVVLWLTPGAGLWNVVMFALLGHPPRRWFSPVPPLGRAGDLVLRIARLASGVAVPRMEIVPPDDVLKIARYVNRTNTPRGIFFVGFVNPVLRLILTAEENGISLGDVVFLLVGEPLTLRKRRQVEKRGYRLITRFGFSELGTSAYLCPRGREADDLHVLIDKVAVRQHRRAVDGDETQVSAYLFTSLLPHARHVLLNVESGDYGGLEERRCGCFLERAGLRLHMHTVRSFEKLTAEGITFLGPSLIELVEEVLPRQFGGDSRHYQLVEAEDARGLTRLYLLASPQLGPLDEEALRRTVLREIGERHLKGVYGRVVEQVWERAETIRVLRRDPLLTSGGKILHLHRDEGMLRTHHDDQGGQPLWE